MTASEAVLNENDNIKLDPNLITYSEKYDDGKYEYRNIILPKDFAVHIPRTHLLTETEWRNLGILQSPGWVHYCTHGPEPHVLMFRRLLKNSQSQVIEIN